jgi:hypothetical protein
MTYFMWAVITVMAVIAFVVKIEQRDYIMAFFALAFAIVSAGEVLRNRP